MDVIEAEAGFTCINDLKIEMPVLGAGKSLVFLHAENGPNIHAPVLDLLAQSARVYAPSHPGFGRSDLDLSLTGIDDLALFYADMLRQFDLRDVTLVGVGLGGWIAAEMAVHDTSRLGRLVLADAVGIKISDRTTRDIVDMFAHTERSFAELAWADPKLGLPDTTQLPDDVLFGMARARESTSRYAWSPYMHDPKLRRRLRRIDIPTTVLWGAADRVVTPDYGRAYAAEIPGATFKLIEAAGHYPHLEQPAHFASSL